MIYGGFSYGSEKIYFQNLLSIKSIIHQNNFFLFPFDFSCLKGGLVFNPKIPKEIRDCFFFDREKGILVLLLGNIYNHGGLKEGFSINQQVSAPELVFHLFENQGERFVEKLNGDFVILIFLAKKKELLIFRDHLGIQPIFYVAKNDVFYFSSDALSLCRGLFPNDQIQKSWLLNNFIFSNNQITAHNEVKSLLPGHYLIISGQIIEQKKYWFPEKIKKINDLKFNEVISELRALVIDSVKIRSNKKYFAGSHLSGGLDSSLVAILARRNFEYQTTFFGFSYSPKSFEDKNIINDERDLVVEVAKKNNITPSFNDFEVLDYFNRLNNFYYNLGSVWEDEIRKKAAQENINLLFSGWGGDEFISKSESGLNSELFFKLNWISLYKSFSSKKPKEILREIIYSIIFPAFGWLIPPSKKELRKRTFYLKNKFVLNDVVELKNIFKYSSLRERILRAIHSFYIAERCENWNIQGFRYGLEYRYPLLDIRIVEYILKIPSKFFLRDGSSRILIREISKGILPEKIRLSKSKLDFTYFFSFNKMLKELTPYLILELEEWKSNPDLDFINFPLLENSIETYKANPDKDSIYLERSLYFFKGLHEFTKTYRSLPEGFEGDEPGEIHNLNTDAAEAGE